jgi:hypothetical protein
MVASSSIAIAEGLASRAVPLPAAPSRLPRRRLGRARADAHRAEAAGAHGSACCCWPCFLLLLAGVRARHRPRGQRRDALDQPGRSGFQAVEAVKLLLILWLASYLVRYRDQVQRHLGRCSSRSWRRGLLWWRCCCCSRTSARRRCCARSPAACSGWAARAAAYLFAPVAARAAGARAGRVRALPLRRLTSFLDPCSRIRSATATSSPRR